MFFDDLFNKLIDYKHNEAEALAAGRIIPYIEGKYGVKVYNCVFRYDDNWYFEGERTGRVTFVTILLTTTRYKNKVIIYEKPDGSKWVESHFDDDTAAIKEIMNAPGMPECSPKLILLFSSFEEEALEICYKNASDYFEPLREKYFNPATMESINKWNMIVTYKCREFLEQAEESGETDEIRRAYYEFIKPFDTFGYITPEHHLLVIFDYHEIALSPRMDYERYWGFMQEE